MQAFFNRQIRRHATEPSGGATRAKPEVSQLPGNLEAKLREPIISLVKNSKRPYNRGWVGPEFDKVVGVLQEVASRHGIATVAESPGGDLSPLTATFTSTKGSTLAFTLDAFQIKSESPNNGLLRVSYVTSTGATKSYSVSLEVFFYDCIREVAFLLHNHGADDSAILQGFKAIPLKD